MVTPPKAQMRGAATTALSLASLLIRSAFVGGRPAMAGQRGLLDQEAASDLAASFNDPWRWVQFKQSSGLPSNSVYDVVETPSGTVWAATQRGLVWYDGFRWHEMGAAQGIPAKQPRAIATYGNDEIVAVIERRLYRGDRDGFEEVRVEVDGTAYEALSVRKAAANGSFLLATTDRDSPIAVLYYDGATARHLSPRTEIKWDQAAIDAWSNGAGVDHDDPEQVFQPFFSTKRDGMGMGLSISRSIIEAHGGQIGYRPSKLGGSAFFFQLPSEQRRAAAMR